MATDTQTDARKLAYRAALNALEVARQLAEPRSIYGVGKQAQYAPYVKDGYVRFTLQYSTHAVNLPAGSVPATSVQDQSYGPYWVPVSPSDQDASVRNAVETLELAAQRRILANEYADVSAGYEREPASLADRLTYAVLCEYQANGIDAVALAERFPLPGYSDPESGNA